MEKRFFVTCLLVDSGNVPSILTVKATDEKSAREKVKVQYKTVTSVLGVSNTRQFLLNNHEMNGQNDYHAILDGRVNKSGRVRMLG